MTSNQWLVKRKAFYVAVVGSALIGSGIPAFTLPEAATPREGLRLAWSVHRVGHDLLLDIPLARMRPVVRA